MDQSLTAVHSRLHTADILITDAGADVGGMWPRAAAWMLRIAIEQAILELWRAVSPQMERVTMRAQLLVLPKYIGEQAAAEARLLWSELSATAHHNDFELAPAVHELRRWQEAAHRVANAVDTAIAARRVQ
ncbi:hypothetical protein IU510_09470 [Nocardia cyriacigeorgica]|uniref:hypothetical protein n=1 Tax=Nocardia cyriacigeorgica TaxID=135487 RepID=UPI001893153A|nr:hypothetical protein [Nocardia cyriacigeorgica]MBF6098304.1 hypothetical protein [Nocardia cyriacigeorgica]